MFGRTTLFFVLAVALIGAAWWYNPFAQKPRTDGSGQDPAGTLELGQPLYPPVEVPKRQEQGGDTFVFDPIVVADSTLFPVHTVNVPSQQDGQLVYVGTEIPEITEAEARALPREQVEVRMIDIDPVDGKKKQGKQFPRYFQRIKGDDRPVELSIIDQEGKKVPHCFYRLKDDDRVEKDQVLALVNPVKAWDKLAITKAKLEVTKSQARAAKAIWVVSCREVDRIRDARRLGGAKTISDSEAQVREAERDKALEEMNAKIQEIEAAKTEVNSAETDLNLYVIRNWIPGTSIVKSIDKKAGEAVKNLEPVMTLHNISLLRREGLVDVSEMSKLKKGVKVRVEPTYEESPLKIMPGHRKEITSVAVSQNAREPIILSGSADKQVGIWSATTGRMLQYLRHPDAVRVVAAAPKGSKKNWFLSACNDGSVRLWDLDDLDNPVLLKDNPHRDAVTALAFSPDGKWFATGGADNLICLWSTEDAKLLYPLDPRHGADNPPQGQITSLTFTPQCRLVAAGRDNALRVWELFTEGVRLVGGPISDRSGTVPQLGVSQDGQQMLFDQGKTLQILSVPGGLTEAVLKKPSTSTPFETLALFSPDASLILTAGAADGRLQLWRAPTPTQRAFEVRVFSSSERSNATCAAFAPKGVTIAGRSFAVSGTREGPVILWPLPTPQEIEQAPVTGTLTLVESSLEAGARQARIGVEIDNTNNRLTPGKQVTVVITP